jgi:ABC-type Mn2+/Zn2+ transport system permease subunit
VNTLHEIFSPEFQLWNSICLGLVVGFACPLVGVYLLLRRMVFLGVALPQVSSCGIAAAFALHASGLVPHSEQGEQALAMIGSTVFTLGTLGLLSVMEHRGRGSADGRVGLAYVLAGAWSILLLVQNPHGQHGLLERLRGEIITVNSADLAITAGTFLVVVALLVLFHKELLLVAYDRDMAITLGKSPLAWDTLFFLLVGLTVSLAVYGVGPLVTFGFLLIPPMIAHRLASGMVSFAVLAPVIGGVTSLVGFFFAYRYDLPVGATDIAALGVLYAAATVLSVFRQGTLRSGVAGR